MEKSIKEMAIEIAKQAEDYYINHTIIFPVPKV